MDPVPFTAEVTRAGRAVIVVLEGDVDMATMPVVRDAVRRADLHEDADVFVLDLRQVTFMDTSGLQLLVERVRRAEADGHAFAVVRGPRSVQRMLDIAGLTPSLRLVDSPEEAVADDGEAGAGP
jgi:anti-sigma B factor antagonist